MLRALVTLCVVLFVGSALGVGTARADPPSKERVRELLSAIDSMPPATVWRTLGAATLDVLIELYDDTNEAPFVRMRTLVAAQHYPVPAARTFLKRAAAARGQSDLFVRQALISLGRAFGERAIDDVRPYLSHADADVREGAALSLSRINTEAARAALRDRLPRERSELVRAALQRGLD